MIFDCRITLFDFFDVQLRIASRAATQCSGQLCTGITAPVSPPNKAEQTNQYAANS